MVETASEVSRTQALQVDESISLRLDLISNGISAPSPVDGLSGNVSPH